VLTDTVSNIDMGKGDINTSLVAFRLCINSMLEVVYGCLVEFPDE